MQAAKPPPVNVGLDRKVRCNRLAGHEGPHRKIRASDFVVVVEWTERDGYTRVNGEPVT